MSTGGTTFASDQTITLTLAGTATKGDDYTISSESLTLTAGQASVTATVTAVQDVFDEPNETVLITATHNTVTIGDAADRDHHRRRRADAVGGGEPGHHRRGRGQLHGDREHRRLDLHQKTRRSH